MGGLRLLPSQPPNKSLTSLDAEEILSAYVFFPFKKIAVESAPPHTHTPKSIMYKKTTAGEEVINDSLSAAPTLTSHLLPLPLKTLDTLPFSSAENKSWELPLCCNPVLLGV